MSSIVPTPVPSLPLELLLAVKDFISPRDLCTHVCYANTCRAVASLYDDAEQQGLFWRDLCRSVGIGRTLEDEASLKSWKEIAFECVAIDGFCQHPGCGVAILESNERDIQTAKDTCNWTPESGLGDDGVDYDNFQSNSLQARLPFTDNEALHHHIRFKEEGCVLYMNEWERREQDGWIWTSEQRMTDHPMFYRSFATFPAISRICVRDLTDRKYSIRNPSGITLWDLTSQLNKSLDTALSTHELMIIMEELPTDRRLDLEITGGLPTVRDGWAMLGWGGMERDDEFTESGVTIDLFLEAAENTVFGMSVQ